MNRFIQRFISGIVLLFAAAPFLATPARAVPSFAAQTGQPCQACHVGGFGPQLTPFGREFKINGYTLRSGGATNPLAAMLIASYVHTKSPQEDPPSKFNANDNVAVDQISGFFAGGFGQHFGAFIQGTYDGVGHSFAWDNVDLRTAWKTTLAGQNVVLGASLNNSPTVQDPWNTLSAWGYPYTDSGLAPTPTAAPFSDGAFAQNTAGITAYAWINSQFYLEAGGYRSLGVRTIDKLGVDPEETSKIDGLAPYARVGYQRTFGQQNVQIGGFALFSRLFPGRDETASTTDRVSDVGADASYQFFPSNGDAITVNARYTHELQRLDASALLDLAANRRNTLNDIRANASYYWRGKIGATIGAFNTWGSADETLYAFSRTASPDSSGLTFQVDDTLFGDRPLGKRFNLRTGIQYTEYLRVDGAKKNFDGAGTNAAADNTLRIFLWGAF